MHTFMPAVHQGRDRQFQLPVHRDLLLNRHRIRFHQRKLKAGHILISDPFPIQRIETNPRTRFRFPVPDGCSQIIRIAVQGGNQLFCRAVIHTLGRHPFPVIGLPRVIRDIAHIVPRLEQSLQVQDQILRPFPDRLLRIQVTAFPVVFQHIVPVHDAIRAGKRCPAPILRQLDNRRAGHRRIAALEGSPPAGTLTRMIPSAVQSAPLVPYTDIVPFRFQRHPHAQPRVMIQLSALKVFQRRKNIVHPFVLLYGVYALTFIPNGMCQLFAASLEIRALAWSNVHVPTCLNPYRSRQRICLGVDRPSS